jgi:putative nucleotidyltransferase with HDIG domain
MNKNIEDLINLYNTKGTENYFGEDVSKREHMIQAAVSAQEGMESEILVLACLLHDIGHLLEKDDMGGLGVTNHGVVGKEYLEKIGMNKKVCKLVNGHVSAKRYLVSIDESYYEKLSDASKKTLEYQGGKMNTMETEAFEKDVDIIEILGVRYHDDNGKKINVKDLPTIESFIPLIKKYIKRTLTEYI